MVRLNFCPFLPLLLPQTVTQEELEERGSPLPDGMCHT